MNHSDDYKVVARLLGRNPQGEFEVVVRRNDGSPVVIQNSPILDSGRPMPTLYWLVDTALVKAVGRLESTGGVKEAERAVGKEAIETVHSVYAEKRDAFFQAEYEKPRPYGGVGGTRQGLKCLHAHYANFLATKDDPVGLWVDTQLAASGDEYNPANPAAPFPLDAADD